ncbi:cytochrome c-type biogenesis protein [Parvularcula oceani]|uniref:cytochrome c-type biogenesis protein n=1 Tax=Parvularcula oceani TaxID=1247963 RepID=UPI00068F8B92|nr:cytochrome c-type biogenesis protein [Parvularcula oceani]
MTLSALLLAAAVTLTPVEAARADALSDSLRCVVCQNQSIADSDAALADDMRELVRQRVAAGDSDEEVRAYIVQRYGEYVLLRPRANARNLPLWAGPGLALLIGAIVMYLFARKAKDVPFEDEEDA